MATGNYPCQACRKGIKLTYRLTRHINMCTSQQVFLIYMRLKQDEPILRENDNISENFGLHKNEEFILEEQDIE